MPIEKGTYVTSSVRLVRPLGKGGMGSVWVARHERLDAEVAVKFVAPELAEKDPSMLERFAREAALSAKLKSPHAVKTFDHGVMEDGRPYIVMELLEGETLGARLQRQKRLSAAQVCVVVTQVAQVLDEAHRLGVVHRDIKPDNIFLLTSGYELFVKVLDFGIAKQTTSAVSSVTDTGAIVGTPEYMSPEQLLSTKSADHRADMWSLAVLAYHALTGRVPFSGETLPSLSIEICGGRFTPPSDLVEGLPAAFDDWFGRALDPDPAQRFESVLAMAAELRQLVRGLDLGSADTIQTPPRLAPSEGEEKRISGDAATLASASDAAPHAAPPPDVGVEDAVSVDSGVRPSFPDAGADESGRRPAAGGTLIAGQSPTFAGAASNLEPTSAVERRRARFKLGAVLLGGLLAAAAADFTLRGMSSSRPADASGMASAGDEASAVASGLVDEVPSSTSASPTAAALDASASASGPPASASASSAVAVAPPPRPRATQRPKPPPPAPSASASAGRRSGCENPYVLRSDGTIGVKPECL